MSTSPDTELFQLCKKVYELTKWVPEEYAYELSDDFEWQQLYTSDYLLEKLPRYYEEGMLELSTRQSEYRNGWIALYVDEDSEPLEMQATSDTPLKALLKLVIALKEAGVEL
jgi:hypothetical protein